MRNLLSSTLILLAVLISGCQSDNPVIEDSPEASTQALSEEQTAALVAQQLSKSIYGYGTAGIVHDLSAIALYPDNPAIEEDLIGMLKNDSTITYETDTYSTTLTYEITYKVGNQISENYSPLSDTAYIHYTITSTMDNIQFSGDKNSESVQFIVAGIRMPTTSVNVNLNTVFDMNIHTNVYPEMDLYLTGSTSFKDIVVNLATAAIQSGTGTVEFIVSTNTVSSESITAEIEFTGDGEAVVRINGNEYTIDIVLGILVP